MSERTSVGEVRLRETVEADFRELFEQERDEEANWMAAMRPREWEAFVAHRRKILAGPGMISRTVEVDGQVAGSVGSWAMEGERLVGYWIGKEWWGKGVATRALAALLEMDRARPLFARVAKRNVGSRRVLEKCGFGVVGEEVSDHPRGEAVEEWVYRIGDGEGGAQ